MIDKLISLIINYIRKSFLMSSALVISFILLSGCGCGDDNNGGNNGNGSNVPDAPGNLVAEPVSSSQIDLSWEDNSDSETGFRIERAPDDEGSPGDYEIMHTASSDANSYNDTGLAPETRYHYRVYAFIDEGDSLPAEASATTQANPGDVPASPSDLEATVISHNQIDLSWTDNSENETGFIIERAPDNGGCPAAFSEIARPDPSSGVGIVQFSDSSLEAEKTYYYQIRAYNLSGHSDSSNMANATTDSSPYAGGCWYVDNSASGSNEGTSWENAWQSFSSINWASIEPGDTVYISGGSTSKTYNEGFAIGASGSDGQYITVTVGANAPNPQGHDGEVWIDCNDSEDNYGIGIRIRDRSYIKISGHIGGDSDCHLHVTDTLNDNITVSGSVHHIILEYLDLTYADNSGDAHCTNIFFEYDNNSDIGEIHHCKCNHSGSFGIWTYSSAPRISHYGELKIHHNEIYNFHGDGARLDGWSVDFYNNKIYNALSPLGGHHPDGIQSNANYIRIFNNIFYDFIQEDGTTAWNAYIRYNPSSTEIRGYAIIYNNLFYETRIPNDGTAGRGIEISPNAWPGGCTGVEDIYFVYNSVLAGPFFGLFFGFRSESNSTNVKNMRIQGNIFQDVAYTSALGGAGPAVSINNGDGSISIGGAEDGVDFIVDHNILYASSSEYKTSVQFGSSDNVVTYSYADFKDITGCQDTDAGSPVNPLLGTDFIPENESAPPVGNGANLSDIIGNYDINGNERNPNWTIGAFEYVQ